MSDSAPIIRGVLIQVADAKLLLPNATIAEVLSYADPDPVPDAPDWLLGRIRWRGWQLPLVAFSRFTGIANDEQGGLGSKVIVLKALGGDAKRPFFAILTQGFPRLVTVTDTALESDSRGRFRARGRVGQGAPQRRRCAGAGPGDPGDPHQRGIRGRSLTRRRNALGQPRSPYIACKAAIAASPAVSVRKMRGPSRTPLKPAAAQLFDVLRRPAAFRANREHHGL